MTLGLGVGVSAASAQAQVICAPGYHFAPGFGCVGDVVAYRPGTAIYLNPPVAVYPGPSTNYALGLQNGIDGGDHQHGDYAE